MHTKYTLRLPFRVLLKGVVTQRSHDARRNCQTEGLISLLVALVCFASLVDNCQVAEAQTLPTKSE
jgi:hypothetical protein